MIYVWKFDLQREKKMVRWSNIHFKAHPIQLFKYFTPSQWYYKYHKNIFIYYINQHSQLELWRDDRSSRQVTISAETLLHLLYSHHKTFRSSGSNVSLTASTLRVTYPSCRVHSKVQHNKRRKKKIASKKCSKGDARFAYIIVWPEI